MSVALEDGQIDHGELISMREALEGAGQCIDNMRERLSMRVVA